MMEIEARGVLPEQLFYQFKNLETYQKKWNRHCKRCEIIKKDGDCEVIF